VKVGYARLSVGDPEGLTLQIQHDRLQAAGCERIYSEVVSGNARHRPEWERLKAEINGGGVSEVAALRMDRLSRSWTAIGEVIDLFSRPDAPRLTLLDDPSIDLNSPGGRTVAGVLSSVAAGERERIVARSTAGLRKRHAAGKRHKLPFGLIPDHEGYPSIDHRPWLSTIEDQRTWSRSEVAIELWEAWETNPTRYAAKRMAAGRFGLVSFGGGSAAVWACNPGLRGALTGGKRDRHGGYPATQEGVFEALIPAERHLGAVATFLRERSSNNSKRTDRATPLSGKVVCAECGYKMQFHRLLSRPGYAWTFRCRREGCGLHDRRVQYTAIAEQIRQHLQAHKARLLQAVAGQLAPKTTDTDLERKIREAPGQMEDLRAMVARRPSPRLQEELASAESELADLQLAAASKAPTTFNPETVLKLLAPLFSGELKWQWDEEAQDYRIDYPLTAAADHPMKAIEALLARERFTGNMDFLIPLAIHSARVDAPSGSIQVRDCLP
jgi:DNA invertase Pin-like site-specific DNA recombinase